MNKAIEDFLSAVLGKWGKPIFFAFAAATAVFAFHDSLIGIGDFRWRLSIYAFFLAMSVYFLLPEKPVRTVGFQDTVTNGGDGKSSRFWCGIAMVVAISSAAIDIFRHATKPFIESGPQTLEALSELSDGQLGEEFKIAASDVELFEKQVAAGSHYELLFRERSSWLVEGVTFPFSTQLRVAPGWDQVMLEDATLQVTHFDPKVVHGYVDHLGAMAGIQNLVELRFDIKPEVGLYKPKSIQIHNNRESNTYEWGARKPELRHVDGWTLLRAFPIFSTPGMYEFSAKVRLTTDWKSSVEVQLNANPIRLCVVDTEVLDQHSRLEDPNGKHWEQHPIETTVWTGKHVGVSETVQVWRLVDGPRTTESSPK